MCRFLYSPFLHALLTGVVLTLGFAPFYLWPLGVLSLVWLYRTLTHATHTKQALWLTFGFGLGHYLSSLSWMPRSFYVDSGGHILPVLYGGIPSLILIAAALSVYLLAVAWLTRWSKIPFLQGTLFTLAWVGVEVLRTVPPLHFPWNPLGAMLANSVTLMQATSVVGVYGLSALLVGCAVLFSYRWPQRVLALAVLFGVYVYGAQRVQQAEALGTQATVRLVQANLETAHSWDDAKRQAYLERHITLSQTADDTVEAIIWPETAVAYAVAEDEGLRQHLASSLHPSQTLSLGFLRFEKPTEAEQAAGATQYRLYNSMGSLLPTGELSSVYDKHKLVPFGEALPFPQFAHLVMRTLAFHRGTYTAGTAPAQVQMTPRIAALPLICYEAAFSGFVQRQLTTQTVLLNITNDNWFDHTLGPHQHFALARMRAVEAGLPLVRAANTGISAVVDPYGRIVQRLNMRQMGAANISVPTPLAGKTLYTQAFEYIFK